MAETTAATRGIQTTFRLLGAAEGDAASRVLLRGLDSARAGIAEAALTATLRRRNLSGHRELVRRWPTLDDRWKSVIKEHRDRLDKVLRDSILGGDAAMGANACQAAIWLHQYDLVPTLLSALQEQLHPLADTLAATLLGLAERLYAELAAPRHDLSRRDPQLARQHVVASLEEAVQRFGKHRRREVVEAFLLLANRDNVGLKQVLQDPHHAAFLAMVDVLSHSPRPGVVRLLLAALDDPHAPSAAISVVGNRCDPDFLRYLLRKVGREPSIGVRQNLKRISQIGWLRNPETHLAQLDDAGQHGAVRLVMTAGVPKNQSFATVEYLLAHGKPGGRRAAAEALDEFTGAEANAAALRALEDADPLVQAAVVSQLRRRGIPGILTRLVELLESPHVVVRQAVRKSLVEFSFKRFVASFDMLEEEVRRSTGLLVKKVDPQTVPLLQGEMRSKVRTRRIRALAIARAIEVAADLEPTVIELLADEDHLVRVEAAATLAACGSAESALALHDALGDRSPAVQEAARKSLAVRGDPDRWPSHLADPRD